MSNTLVRDAILMSLIISAGFVGFAKRDIVYDFIGVHPQDIVDARARRQQPLAAAQPRSANRVANVQTGEYRTAINKSKDGQFWTKARVNNTHIRFLIDTGASIVVLTPQDAQNAGLRPNDLIYDAPINTAAGKIMAAPVEIASISIGDVTVHNIRAVVIKKGLKQSLLGMSYLGELSKLEVTPAELILHQ